MARRKTPHEWQQEAQQVLDRVNVFNTEHPRATWAEIETAVDGALAGFRRDLLADSTQRHALADFRRANQRPVCPHCGAALQADGQVVRRVLTQGDELVEVERTRGRCPACRAELFPPG